jgi:hypothetical protein
MSQSGGHFLHTVIPCMGKKMEKCKRTRLLYKYDATEDMWTQSHV